NACACILLATRRHVNINVCACIYMDVSPGKKYAACAAAWENVRGRGGATRVCGGPAKGAAAKGQAPGGEEPGGRSRGLAQPTCVRVQSSSAAVRSRRSLFSLA